MEYRLTLKFFFLFVSVKYCSGQSFFPDSIPTSELETTNRLKGTRLYLTIPASYKIRTRTTGVQEFEKDSLTGLQVIENVNQNFYQVKGEFLGRSFDIK